MPQPHVAFGLPLPSVSVPGERDLERGGEMEHDVGSGDVPVQPTLERSQETASRRSTGGQGEMPELRSVRSAARSRGVPVTQHDRSAWRPLESPEDERAPLVRQHDGAERVQEGVAPSRRRILLHLGFDP